MVKHAIPLEKTRGWNIFQVNVHCCLKYKVLSMVPAISDIHACNQWGEGDSEILNHAIQY